MKVSFYTLGCKVNAYETEVMKSLFKERGYDVEDYSKTSDIYVINTCTVTNNSDSKSKKMISHTRKNNPKSIIVVVGCFVESAKDYDFKDVDIVIGNVGKTKIVDLVEDYLKNREKIVLKEDIRKTIFEDMEIKKYENRTRAFVKIQDGCENYCSYCIIPFVRGKCRSKPFEKVLFEITSLVKNGYKEIVLTGIHTGNYGCDINTSFSHLLEKILEIPGLKRVRISSIEITELDDKFFELLKNPILCNHLHIPLQSGSDKILNLMNRKYDKKYFKEKIEKIRSIRKDISISTDIIVGFPNEETKDFLELMDFVKDIKFSKIHVFPYSKRNGTKATLMPNHVLGNIKKERARNLINLSRELEYKYFKNFVGKNLDVLIEKYEDGYSYGHTSNYLYLKINKNLKPHEIYNIEIKDEYYEQK